MKTIASIVFVLSCLAAKGQISEVSLKDSTLIQAVNIFLDSVEHLSFKQKTVILVTIKLLNRETIFDVSGDHIVIDARKQFSSFSYVITFSLERDLSFFEYRIPSFVFKIRQRTCFIDFAAHGLIELNRDSRKAVLKQVSKSVDKFSGNSGVAFMEVSVQGDKIQVGQFLHAGMSLRK